MSSQTIDGTANTADRLTSKTNMVIADFRELTHAYQEISAKTVEKLTASISTLSSVKEPAEFIKLQQKFMTEAMNAAVADSAHIVRLTAAAFTAAFKPI